MLKNISPLLNADVLYALKAMGHGDYLILSDLNFPSDSIAQQTVHGSLLRMENTTSAEAAAAILSLMPLDTFIDNAAERMEIVGSPDELRRYNRKCRSRSTRPRANPAAEVDRALCLLREGQEGLLRDPDRRAPLLWLLRADQGRDPAGCQVKLK